MRRRNIVQALGTLIVGGLAGCARLNQGSGSARVGDVTFDNRMNATRTVIVYIERNGEPVFASAYKIPPSKTSATTITGGWPTRPGRYLIAIGLKGQNAPKTVQLSDGGCQSLLVTIENAKLSLFGPAMDADDCPGTSSSN